MRVFSTKCCFFLVIRLLSLQLTLAADEASSSSSLLCVFWHWRDFSGNIIRSLLCIVSGLHRLRTYLKKVLLRMRIICIIRVNVSMDIGVWLEAQRNRIAISLYKLLL